MKTKVTASRRHFLAGLTATAVTIGSGCGDKDDGTGSGAGGAGSGGDDTGVDTDDTGGGGGDDTGETGSIDIEVGEAHVAWAEDGRTFEVDPSGHAIIGYDADGAEAWRLEDLVEEGINFPWEVLVHDSLVYVLLRGSHLVGVLDEDGLPVLGIGAEGDGEGELQHPVDMTVGPDGMLYVTDSHNHRVMVFDHDGEFITHFGEEGVDEDHHLNNPRGMAVDADGLLHVVDRGNRRVHVYSTEGTWQRSYGGEDLVAPESIAIAPDGSIYVADLHDTALHVFEADGSVRERIEITVDGWPAHPAHLSWTLEGALYVRVSAIHHDDVEHDELEEEAR